MHKQGTEAWRKDRFGYVTASRFADVISRGRNGKSYGAARQKYLMQLVTAILTSAHYQTFTTPQMIHGTETEPLAAIAYMRITGVPVYETGFHKIKGVRAGATPDRLVDPDGLLEIKCPDTHTHLGYLMKDHVPKIYVPQIQGEMWATGRQWCDFVSYDNRLPEDLAIKVVRAYRDQEYINMLKREVKLFIHDLNNQLQKIKERRVV